MSLHEWLEEEFKRNRMPFPPHYALDYLKNLEVADYRHYEPYQDSKPFKQLNFNSKLLLLERDREHYVDFIQARDELPVKQPVLRLEAKPGLKARLWRMWHGLYPTNETAALGWSIRTEYRQVSELVGNYKRVRIDLIPIGFVAKLDPYAYGNRVESFQNLFTYEGRYYIGYLAVEDTVIIQPG